MNIISLNAAVSRIKQVCDGVRNGQSRYFFTVGSGISYPVVPTAQKITEDCEQTAKGYDRAEDFMDASAMERYSNWFNAAYPDPKLRQEYLRGLIEQ